MDKCECGAAWTQWSGGQMTCVGYFSPPGHDHDDNCMVRRYVCFTALSPR